mgnify:CR=1 FL=1
MLLPDLLSLVVVIDSPLVVELEPEPRGDGSDSSGSDSDVSDDSEAGEGDAGSQAGSEGTRESQISDPFGPAMAAKSAAREAALLMGYRGPPKRMASADAPGLVGADAWGVALEMRRQVIKCIMDWKHSVRAKGGGRVLAFFVSCLVWLSFALVLLFVVAL